MTSEENKDAYKVFIERSMNDFLKIYGTVKEYYDSLNSQYRYILLEQWYVVEVFICGLAWELGNNVRLFKHKSLSYAYCLALLEEVVLDELCKEIIEDSNGNEKDWEYVMDHDAIWKDNVRRVDGRFNFSERDGSTNFNKLVEMYNGTYEDNKVEDDDFVLCDKFDIWKWPKRKTIIGPKCNLKYGRWKFDIWKWPKWNPSYYYYLYVFWVLITPPPSQVMVALVISISSDVSVESVGSYSPRVILIGSISVEILVALEVGTAIVSSPARMLDLDTHSTSKADLLESLPPPVSVAPMVLPFLCSNPIQNIPTAPILPAPSAIFTPSSEFPLAHVVAPLRIR
ncbi:hypothetical protein Tco_1015215 [Tanacetum coccineum]|uniref:Uncharacterized protein n=1 Tax=Tanacetum coccineum TaxID=301880 RepID=A0ABQ5FLA1_9ASTR